MLAIVFLDPAPSAGWLAGAVAGAAKNSGKDVALPVDHVGVGVSAGGDQADVFRHWSVRGAGPLAVNHFVEVVGLVDIVPVGLL